MARCLTCKGLGKVSGMGGLQRDCKVCDGVGKVEDKKPGDVLDDVYKSLDAKYVDAVDTPVKPVEETPEIVHEVKKKEVEAVETLDEITKACIEEPRMDPISWKNKYQHVEGLFCKSIITGQMDEVISKVERAAIRTSYAMQTPAAPRKVNLNKAQDNAGKADPDYIAYQNKEKARLKKEAEAKK